MLGGPVTPEDCYDDGILLTVLPDVAIRCCAIHTRVYRARSPIHEPGYVVCLGFLRRRVSSHRNVGFLGWIEDGMGYGRTYVPWPNRHVVLLAFGWASVEFQSTDLGVVISLFVYFFLARICVQHNIPHSFTSTVIIHGFHLILLVKDNSLCCAGPVAFYFG